MNYRNEVKKFCWISIAGVLFISYAMHANGALFSFLTIGTPLVLWRQMLFIVGLLIIFQIPKQLFANNAAVKNITIVHLVYLVYLAFSSLYVYIGFGFNDVRIAYSWWLYLCGVPFFFLPIIYFKKNGSALVFFRYFAILGVFQGVGLAIDANTTLFHIVKYAAFGQETVEMAYEGENRASFLSDSITSFSVSYAFSILSLLWLFYKEKKMYFSFLYLFGACICVSGAWFTGSRQIFICMVTILLAGVGWLVVWGNGRHKIVIAISVIVTLVCFGKPLGDFLLSNEELNQRYSVEYTDGDPRVQMWKSGVDSSFSPSCFRYLIIGHGISYASGQKALAGEVVGSHYENTIFHRISEVGLLGTLIYLYPVYYLLMALYRSRWGYFEFLSFCIVVLYLFVAMVSPNGAYPLTMMTMYMLCGMCTGTVRNKLECVN